MRFSKSTEGQWAELEQTKGANAHAVAACEQAVTELVDHQSDNEGLRRPSRAESRVQPRDRHKFRGRWRVGGGALGDGQHKLSTTRSPASSMVLTHTQVATSP